MLLSLISFYFVTTRHTTNTLHHMKTVCVLPQTSDFFQNPSIFSFHMQKHLVNMGKLKINVFNIKRIRLCIKSETLYFM